MSWCPYAARSRRLSPDGTGPVGAEVTRKGYGGQGLGPLG